jgi:Domain of unknown function (DUF4279)
MGPRISTHLTIAGDELDVHECTKAIGLRPTEVGRAKARVPGTGRDWWAFGFEKREHYSTDDAVKELLAAVRPHRKAILDFVASHDVQLSFVCNVTITDERPVYELRTEVLVELASWGAEFAMDVFDYSE